MLRRLETDRIGDFHGGVRVEPAKFLHEGNRKLAIGNDLLHILRPYLVDGGEVRQHSEEQKGNEEQARHHSGNTPHSEQSLQILRLRADRGDRPLNEGQPGFCETLICPA
jgi:hypothetical protein